MTVIAKLIMLGIAIVCAVTLVFIILDFITDGIRNKPSKKINRVHFYVARDMDGNLWLYMGKPNRGVNEFEAGSNKYCVILTDNNFEVFGLNENDYKDIKWEDEPVEVFINLED